MTQIAEPTPAGSPLPVTDPEEPAQVDNWTEPFFLSLRWPESLRQDEDWLLALSQENPDLRFEYSAEGELIIMSPNIPDGSDRNAELTFQLRGWAKQDGRGVAYDATAGFTLPNGAKRAPDATWILKERVSALSPQQRKRYWPLCPDFVAEVRSPSDRLRALQRKMEEYIANGAQLGWLIDPEPRRIFIYRPGEPVQHLDNPSTVSGDPVLPGFVLDAQAVFDTSV
jgi:Uma2 family endonuclease